MRPIDADELKKRAVKVRFPDTPECGEFDAVGVPDIDIMPTIDPETQRPIGTWIVTKTNVCGINRYECPFCGTLRFRASAFRLNYCSYCGEKLVNADE